MADSRVSLKVEFDDSAVASGVDRVRRQLDEAGEPRRAGEAPRRSGGRGEAADDRASQRGEQAASATIRNMVLGQITGSITNSVVQAFDPLKTDFQRQELLARAGAEAAGTTLGAALGGANPDPTTRNASVLLGAQLGQSASKIATEAALQSPQIAEDRFVNDRVAAVLKQEAANRAAVGGTLSASDAESIGKILAESFRLEFQNMMAALTGANKATPDLGASLSDAINRGLKDAFAGITNGVGSGLNFQKVGDKDG